MAETNCAEILERWLAGINGHDVSTLTALMAVDHVFIDSLGNRVQGSKSMEAGWRGYFEMCPDYWIRTSHTMADGETMLVAGEAGGTIDGEAWRIPAAWKAVIREGAVLEWQVFADNKPVYEILKSDGNSVQPEVLARLWITSGNRNAQDQRRPRPEGTPECSRAALHTSRTA